MNQIRYFCRAANWITKEGRFIANLDMKNIELRGGLASRIVTLVPTTKKGRTTLVSQRSILTMKGSIEDELLEEMQRRFTEMLAGSDSDQTDSED